MPFEVHCAPYFVDYLPLSTSDAFAAAALIPTPFGVMIDNFTPTSRQVDYPIIFHSGEAAVEIHAVNPGTTLRRLTRSEQAFNLWPMAQNIAVQIILECVEDSQGVKGGGAQFQVNVEGHPTRNFAVVVKSRPFNLRQFLQDQPLDYQIWPPL